MKDEAIDKANSQSMPQTQEEVEPATQPTRQDKWRGMEAERFNRPD
jgi:hypothetical protein